jgi:phospholipid transport system substrate-binding protein
MKRLFGLLFALLVVAPQWAGAADIVPPDVQIKNITNEVLDIISKDKDLQENGKTGPAIEKIDAKVLQPHFNFSHMTSLAMGKEWRKATPEQKKVLIQEFKTLLVRTYSNALTIYKTPTVKFKPSHFQPTDTEVLIRTQVLQPGINPADIDYSLEKVGDEWKVFDVVVDGVSLVTNYRDFFAQEVRKGGIEGAIKSLQTKNRTLTK